ncbi:lysozyme inhibitor LprI family protein [Martelella endophytica]|uniref:Periplasmic protein n=1 Tax=Martelella endophytica TaxID=1486262 RepID=A0A0D5LVK1_MAREN|nr:periplasmic protein [Martelella endophytica]
MAAVFTTATCIGSALVTTTPAAAASFDCNASGLTPNEKTICDNRALNDDDVKMATMYTMLKGLFAMGVSGNMGDDQKAWLQTREACGTDVSCIGKAYDTRIEQLQKLYDGIDKPL